MKLTPADAIPPPSIATLFLTCARVGSLSFGGGLSGWLYREFVIRHRWLSDDDFASTLTLAQIMPGANVLNLVVCLGEILGGPRGALACVSGFIIPPVIAVIALAVVLDHVVAGPWLDIAMSGIAFAAMGLLLQIVWRGVWRMRTNAWQLLIAVAAFVGAGVLRQPIPLVVLVLAPVALFLSWRADRR